MVFSTPINCLWTPTRCCMISLRADTNWSLCTPHRLQAQPPTTFPTSDADPSGVSSGHPHSRLTQLQIRSSHKARPQVCSFAIMTHRIQGNTYLCGQSILWWRTQRRSQVKKHFGRGPEGSRVQRLLSLWSWGVPPHTRMSSYSGDPCTSGIFMEPHHVGTIHY